ncbi:uncharacterized protein MELLADRAFT_64301 [Melampsora larici-populina 98AG31]|uniref:Uncharacterized protein n=1 Tax=Melampsora larici-populina (strain 98AG31 / pathotype 3-4-7) TaxID=747676 RepID=F4RQY0_MELLP|nr:uncharacterized protein MELLADRAFT_64301 [Melampsora larici-populina 98AG31]EGG05243.1 hypothetical protein MELLADRAFT_64301 [Melampsora larici-populina 98AG31]
MSNTFTSDAADFSAPRDSTHSELDQVEQSQSRITDQLIKGFSDSGIKKRLECPTTLEYIIPYPPSSDKEILKLAAGLDNCLETREGARLVMSHATHTPEAVEQWSRYIQAKFWQSGRPLPRPIAAPHSESSQGSSLMGSSAHIPALDGSLSLGSSPDGSAPQFELACRMPAAQILNESCSLLNLSHQIHLETAKCSNSYLEQVELWKLARDLGTQSWLTFNESSTVSPQSSSDQSSTPVTSIQTHSVGRSFEDERTNHDPEQQEPKNLSKPIFLNELSPMETKLDLAEESPTTVSDTPPSIMNKAGQMMEYEDVFSFPTEDSRRSESPAVQLEKKYWLRTVPTRSELSGQKKQARSREEDKTSIDGSPVFKRIKRV